MCLSPAQDQAEGFPLQAGPWRAPCAAPAAVGHSHTGPSSADAAGPSSAVSPKLGMAPKSLLHGHGLCRSSPNPWAHDPAWLQPVPKEAPVPQSLSCLFPLKITPAEAVYHAVLCKAYSSFKFLSLLQPTALKAAL